MGSIISLGIGRLEIDWGKNNFFQNHSKLFLPDDISLAPYYFIDDETGEPVAEMRAAFVRPVRKVLRRLELLGYSLTNCRQIYNELFEGMPDYYERPQIDFDLFARAVAAVDTSLVRIPDSADDWDLGEYVVSNILADPEFTKTSADFDQLSREDGTFFENLDPCVTLRLLAKNPANLDLLLIWRHADVVEGGWAKEADLYEGPNVTDGYLIVTEGSTDALILKKSLSCVASDVADFFDFVDMSENYPFTGTGNLVRFCQGLVKIKIQNRILILLDNDTAGRSAYEQINKLQLPVTMTLMLLPKLPEFVRICTLGPAGEQIEDVNGRAVAIEAFLDLGFQGSPKPVVRWTSFDRRMKEYQGELIDKECYVKIFVNSVGKSPDYDLTKLEYLWSCILEKCGCEL